MKRYKFRLGQVLRVRSIERDRAVGEVARARTDVADAERRVLEAQRIYRDLPAPSSSTAAELQAQLRIRRLLVDAIAAAQAVVVERQLVLDARLAEWTEADKKVRLLEELDQRSRERHRQEVLADEQQALDDLVTSRHAGAVAS